MNQLVEQLNNYAMAALTVTVAVSSVLRLLGLSEKSWAKPVLAICFDAGGAIKGYLDARKASK